MQRSPHKGLARSHATPGRQSDRVRAEFAEGADRETPLNHCCLVQVGGVGGGAIEVGR